MKSFHPKDLKELLSIKDSIRRDGSSPYLGFYRGQIFDWPIKPSITRNKNLTIDEILKIEKLFFSNFHEEELGIKILQHFEKDTTKYAQDWHNLFQAQHLGFYTRLTDWTQEFDHAMLFATDDESNEHENSEGVIWIYKCPYDDNQLINFNRPEDDKYFDISPFELDKAYMVKHYSQFSDDFENFAAEIRRFRQDGSFIISKSEDIIKPIEEIDYINYYLEKIIISSDLKKEIKEYLPATLKDYFYYGSSTENENAVINIKNITTKKNNELFWSK